jgi:hypothetical protein
MNFLSRRSQRQQRKNVAIPQADLRRPVPGNRCIIIEWTLADIGLGEDITRGDRRLQTCAKLELAHGQYDPCVPLISYLFIAFTRHPMRATHPPQSCLVRSSQA